jgi:AcrR family transcriptional regulator
MGAGVIELQDRRESGVRDTIVRNAMALFSEYGYREVTINQIAYASACSFSTFQRYLGEKEDVLFPSADEVAARLRVGLGKATTKRQAWHDACGHARQHLTAFVAGCDPEQRALCVRLWFSEAEPRRRYLELMGQWEDALVEHFAAAAPSTSHQARLERHLRASAITSAARAVLCATADPGEDAYALIESTYDQLEMPDSRRSDLERGAIGPIAEWTLPGQSGARPDRRSPVDRHTA